MRKLVLTLLACLALGATAIGCGGDDSSSGSDDQATSGQAGGTGKTVEVEIIDIDYDPRDVTVKRGQSVTWTNNGGLPHTVTKDGGPGPDFDSGTVELAETFEQRFDTPGTISYFCKIHPQQAGTVTVK